MARHGSRRGRESGGGRGWEGDAAKGKGAGEATVDAGEKGGVDDDWRWWATILYPTAHLWAGVGRITAGAEIPPTRPPRQRLAPPLVPPPAAAQPSGRPRRLFICSTTGARRRRWRGRRSTRTRGGVGGVDEVGLERNGDGGTAYERRCEPVKGRAWPIRPARGPSGRGRRARQATTDQAPLGGCSALRAERSLPLVCNDLFGGLCMRGGKYLHWLVTARVKPLSENSARATVSALLGRRATTAGGTAVSGK